MPPNAAPAPPVNQPLLMILDPLQCAKCGMQYAMHAYDHKDVAIRVGNMQAIIPNASGIECVHCHDGHIDGAFHETCQQLFEGLLRFSRMSEERAQLVLL